jgi:hypothetical protein
MSRAFWPCGLTTILMQSIAQHMEHTVAFLRRLVERFRSWRARRTPDVPVIAPQYIAFPAYSAAIHRDVTPHGVRVYSLCGDCGCRLQASATLCEDCAQKRSRPARPY